MKKIKIVLLLVAAASLFGCKWFSEANTRGPETKFSNEKEFYANKDSWQEPANYSFLYDFSIGDSYVGAKCYITVTDGKSRIIKNFRADSECPELKTIAEAYNFFANDWEKRKSEPNTEYWINYKATFEDFADLTNGSSIKYPSELDSSISIAKPDYVGYGGNYIRIQDFSLINAKNFAENRKTWVEPESCSYTYRVWLVHGRQIMAETGNVDVTVTNGTANFKFNDESVFNRDKDKIVEHFLSETDLKFGSISEIYDTMIAEWNEREKHAEKSEGYFCTAEYKKSGDKVYPWVFEALKFNEYDEQKIKEYYSDSRPEEYKLRIAIYDLK